VPQIDAFAGRYRVRAPDLPGHGEAPGPFTLGRAIESVRASIGDADGPAQRVGISGGATVALLTSLDDPGRVASLVLSVPVARPPPAMLSLMRAGPGWARFTDALRAPLARRRRFLGDYSSLA
jgi:3-oxoadipate enol-lactonase